MKDESNTVLCLLNCGRIVDKSVKQPAIAICCQLKQNICENCLTMFNNFKEIGLCRILSCEEVHGINSILTAKQIDPEISYIEEINAIDDDSLSKRIEQEECEHYGTNDDSLSKRIEQEECEKNCLDHDSKRKVIESKQYEIQIPKNNQTPYRGYDKESRMNYQIDSSKISINNEKFFSKNNLTELFKQKENTVRNQPKAENKQKNVSINENLKEEENIKKNQCVNLKEEENTKNHNIQKKKIQDEEEEFKVISFKPSEKVSKNYYNQLNNNSNQEKVLKGNRLPNKVEEIKNLKNCPKCGKTNKMEKESKFIKCWDQNCSVKYCKFCDKILKDSNLLDHFPETGNYETCKGNEDLVINIAILPETIPRTIFENDSNLLKCPKCSIDYIVEGGCNFLTCKSFFCQSKVHFCQICKKLLKSEEKIKHFPNGLYGKTCANKIN